MTAERPAYRSGIQAHGRAAQGQDVGRRNVNKLQYNNEFVDENSLMVFEDSQMLLV